MKLNVAAIILYDAGGRLLLQYRGPQAPRLQNHWAFFGGALEGKETPRAAVCREALEELGYSLKDPELVFEQDFLLDTIAGHMWVFVEGFYGDKSELRLLEGEDWGWYTAQEAQALRMIAHDRVVVEKVARFLAIKTKKENNRD